MELKAYLLSAPHRKVLFVKSLTSVRNWIATIGATAAHNEPGSPWENGHCESFNTRFRDELLNRKKGTNCIISPSTNSETEIG
jgi:transposase InsO family protein